MKMIFRNYSQVTLLNCITCFLFYFFTVFTGNSFSETKAHTVNSALNSEAYSQCFSSFYEGKYEEAVGSIDELYALRPKDRKYYEYKSVFYSYLIKQGFEAKKNLFSLISITASIRSHNDEYIEEFPEYGGGYTGLAEQYQYSPAIFGGGIKKAERFFIKATNANCSQYDIYKALLFCLNTEKDYTAARKLLDILKSGEGFYVDTYLKKYLDRWIIYQEGVWFYYKELYKESGSNIKKFLALVPDAYWGYYIQWKLSQKMGNENIKYAELAKEYAQKQNNVVFVKNLEKELNDGK